MLEMFWIFCAWHHDMQPMGHKVWIFAKWNKLRLKIWRLERAWKRKEIKLLQQYKFGKVWHQRSFRDPTLVWSVTCFPFFTFISPNNKNLHVNALHSLWEKMVFYKGLATHYIYSATPCNFVKIIHFQLLCNSIITTPMMSC
jgi:hypothetical protein